MYCLPVAIKITELHQLKKNATWYCVHRVSACKCWAVNSCRFLTSAGVCSPPSPPLFFYGLMLDSPLHLHLSSCFPFRRKSHVFYRYAHLQPMAGLTCASQENSSSDLKNWTAGFPPWTSELVVKTDCAFLLEIVEQYTKIIQWGQSLPTCTGFWGFLKITSLTWRLWPSRI